MSTSILWTSDSTMAQLAPQAADQEIIYANMLGFARTIARPDTEFVLEFVNRNAGAKFAPWFRHPRSYVGIEVVERIRLAEQRGVDAAFAGMCYGEYFLQDARQAVKMPVVGPAESTMMLAQQLGRKFAVITVAGMYVPAIEDAIRFHGWQSRTIGYRPVRYWQPSGIARLMLAAYDGRPEELIREFEEQALECVRDGADVVICGCNPYGAALAQVGYNWVADTGVPVVTALPAMIKQAEQLVDLKRSLGLAKTEAVVGPYRTTSLDIIEDMQARGIGVRPIV